MRKILDFEYRGKPYTIYDVDKIEGKDSYLGETNYKDGIILIEEGNRQEMLDTLKHELAHVWLYENGHPYQVGGCFTYEEMCEYIAFSTNFVCDISRAYMSEKEREWYVCQ